MKRIILGALLLWLSLSLAPAQAQEPLTANIVQIQTNRFPQVTVVADVLMDGLRQPGLGEDNFSLYEENNEQDLLQSVTELSPYGGLKISLVFDFDPTGRRELFRPMQEWSQAFIDELGLTAAPGRPSRQIEILTAAGAELTALTADPNAAKNGVRRLVIEDMNDRDLNQTLTEILSQPSGDQRPVIVVVGSGGELSGLSGVVEQARQQNGPIYTVAFSSKVQVDYMTSLAVETGAEFFDAPETGGPAPLVAHLLSQLEPQYRLRYRSSLYQTDGGQHPLRLVVEVGQAQAETSAALDFPVSHQRLALNSLPLLWAWSLILGGAILFLMFKIVTG